MNLCNTVALIVLLSCAYLAAKLNRAEGKGSIWP